MKTMKKKSREINQSAGSRMKRWSEEQRQINFPLYERNGTENRKEIVEKTYVK